MSARTALAIFLLVSVLLVPPAASGAPACVLDSMPGGAGATWTGVASVGPDGFYLSDAAFDRILRVGPDGGLRASWGGPGGADGFFRGPAAVAVGPAGFVYVADAFNHRIQKFTAAGGFVAAWGGLGSEPGRFRVAAGVAVDAAGNVYVADAGNRRIQKFTAAGGFVTAWSAGGALSGEPDGGSRGRDRYERYGIDDPVIPASVDYGAALSGLAGPVDVAVDAQGAVYALDAAGKRVERFDATGSPRGSVDLAVLGVAAPSAIAVDAAGTMVVTDGAGRVWMLTATGSALDGWSGYTPPGTAVTPGDPPPWGRFERHGAGAPTARTLAAPAAAGMDPLGRIMVADGADLIGFAYPSPPTRVTWGVYPWDAANRCGVASDARIPFGILGSAALPAPAIDAERLTLTGSGSPVAIRLCDVGCPPMGTGSPLHTRDGCCDLLFEFTGAQVWGAAGGPGNAAGAEITLTGVRRDGTPLWGALTIFSGAAGPTVPGHPPGGHYQRLTYRVPEAAPVRVSVFDVNGRLVEEAAGAVQAAGEYTLAPPAGAARGIYFYRIEIGPRVETRKLVLIR